MNTMQSYTTTPRFLPVIHPKGFNPCGICFETMEHPHVVRIDSALLTKLEVCENPACRKDALEIRDIAEGRLPIWSN